MITSTSNPKIKYVRRLLADRRFRERERAYVIEGTRWLAELVQFDLTPQLVLATVEWLQADAHQSLLASLSGPIVTVSDQVLAHASDTASPAGVLAVVPQVERLLPRNPSLVLILDRLGNPGNLGTILRTAAAAGADGVLLSPGSVDLYNPKVIRGAMGAHLRLPVQALSWSAIADMVNGLTVWLAAAAGDARAYDTVDWRRPAALIIGSEAAGAGPQAQRLAGGTVAIPMARATESLNAAMAAAILLFEAARQRRLSS
ncbi:MAG: RNA methyltransferase [Candidatus Promineifilaceae bacterium]|nr:RNA methyltransferase [Candidatus Promineifilaceae bacterium]